MIRRTGSAAHGPGDLTLAAVVLFTLGAYGVAAGAVSGEERVVAVGVFAFTLFTVGVVWPVVTLARLSIEVVAPPDATVGDEVPLRVTVHGRAPRLELRVLDPPGGWWRVAAPAVGTVAHVAARRGVYEQVRVQVRTSAPLGVFVRVRQARVTLPVPIAVGPRPRAAAVSLQEIPDDAPAEWASVATAGRGEAVRAVRPYVPGDPARYVHWATSARRGELAVREHEPPPARGLALVVDLTGDLEQADAAAEVAAGAGRAVLAAGGALVVATHEPGGPVCAPVGDGRALGRRLARATGGPPGPPPPRWPVQLVRAGDRAGAGA